MLLFLLLPILELSIIEIIGVTPEAAIVLRVNDKVYGKSRKGNKAIKDTVIKLPNICHLFIGTNVLFMPHHRV